METRDVRGYQFPNFRRYSTMGRDGGVNWLRNDEYKEFFLNAVFPLLLTGKSRCICARMGCFVGSILATAKRSVLSLIINTGSKGEAT